MADFVPEAVGRLPRRAGRRGPQRRALPRRTPTASELWFETTHAPVVDERGIGHRGLPERARHQHAEAGRAGAPGERGALPRPVRQRERPGLRHRSRRRVPLREPGLAPGHRTIRRGAWPPPLPRRRASRQPGAVRRGRGARAGRRDADPRRAGPGDRAAARRSRWRGTSAARSRTAGRSMLRGIYRDVTERKRVEDQLRRAERMQAAGRLAGGDGARGQQHDDRRHRLQRVPAPEPRPRTTPPRRRPGDHPGRHPGLRRHPPAPRLHPPAAAAPRSARRQRRGERGGEDAPPLPRRGSRAGAQALARTSARSGRTAGSSSRCSST